MKNKLSIIVWLLVSLFAVKTTVNLHPWNRKTIIDQDIIFYYGYLPATFIYHDWSFMFPDKPGFTGKVWSLSLPDGNRIQKMSMGVAFLYAPFFAIAHIYTLATGGVANGYSPNYQIALVWAGLFYFILGLLLIRKILSLYFSDGVTASSLLVIGLGTNLFNYATWDGAMSHVYSFFLFALTFLIFIRWLDSPKILKTLLLGLCAGLIVLIRPTDLLFVSFLSMLFFFQQKPWAEKWQFMLDLKWKWLILIGGVFLIWMPQFIYWKMNTGHWLYYSYIGEPFYFKHPQILNGLFSYRKGWLIYTPVMSLALIGIFTLRNKLKVFFWPSLISILLVIYVTYSWWCWWYGGSFGSRPMIEFYVMLSIPLAAFLDWISHQRIVFKGLTGVLLIFFIWLNLFQTTQYRGSLLHYDSMSKRAYWAIWGSTDWPENYSKLIVPTDAEKARRGETEYP
ncbi:MAG TPA: hypothetical protein VFC65_18655 [Prolixibacteraceae bacterium]|nr:hypothetical protein [Prolixibacteraceae bacterium]